MDREAFRLQEAKLYTAYAEELRERFEHGYLAELAELPQFVVWRHQEVEGKPKKPPYSPRYHRLADTSRPESWGTLDQALKALAAGQYQGIGFVFSEHDPYAGFDLDECVGTNGSVDYWARQVIDFMYTHTHYSPRDGLHTIFALDKKRFPGHNQKFGKVEFFMDHHYLTITPRHVPDTPMAIRRRDMEAAYLVLSLAREARDAQANTRGGGETRPDAGVSEQEAVEVIRASLQDTQSNFSRYWSGNPDVWQGPRALRGTRSDAMFTLLVMLADKTGDNEELIKQLYKQSGMYNPQRDDAYAGRDRETGKPVTYLEMSARNAIRKRTKRKPI